MAARVAAQARVRPSLTGATAAAPSIDPHTLGTGKLPVEQLSGTFPGGLLRPAGSAQQRGICRQQTPGASTFFYFLVLHSAASQSFQV